MIFPSCSEDDGSGYIFKMNIEDNPQNLDPQMAVDNESLIIIENMMEGLMKADSSGAIVPAAAESFSMSEDGLKYTFNLRQNQKWESLADFSADVTADDFVFAFQRIFDSATKSPYSSKFMCIKNAGAVLNNVKPVDELGVKALDMYTVEFTLEYPYYDFLSLLTMNAAMPCNREFFEFTKGKYGMSAETTASNGAFYLKEWNYDPYWDNNYIIMRRNKSYSDNSYVYPYGLNFFITDDSSLDAETFSSGNIQCYVADKYDEKNFEGSKYEAYQTKTVGLVFNLNSKYFSKKEIREALSKTINKESYSYILSEGVVPAFGIIPEAVTIQGKSYRDLSPDRALSVYDVNAAGLWEEVLKSSGEIMNEGIKITVSDSFSESELAYSITDQWRNSLLFNCGVEIVSQTEYDSKISEESYDITLIELECESNSAYDYLYAFSENELFKNYINIDFISSLNGMKTSTSLPDGVECIKNAELQIIEDYVFVPLCYKNEYFVYDGNSEDLNYSPFESTVWFGEAKKYD